MKRNVIFLLILILLYLVPALTLKAVYGPSYNLLLTENEWQPDGQGGWVQVGEPTSPMPDKPSVMVPYALQYIPILLPGLVLIVVLLTPLSRLLETKKPAEQRTDSVPEGTGTTDVSDEGEEEDTDQHPTP